MKTRLLLLFALLLVSPAFALLIVQRVTPDATIESGTTVQYRRAPDGNYAFTFTRYLANETRAWPGSELSDLTFQDSATLEVRSNDKVLATARVEGERKDDTVVYTFALARECIAQSRFSVYEYVAHKDKTKPQFLGGMMYEIDFADIDRRLKTAVRDHP